MEYELSALGFGPFFERQLSGSDAPELIPARIAAEHRGAYEVWSARSTGRAQLAGRLKHGLDEPAVAGVGDWVLLQAEPGPNHTAVIERVLERRTVFARGAAGRQARTQVVAANVDRVFAVCGLDGDFNVRRLERYLAGIWASGAEPVVILNKADLCADLAGRIATVESHCIGVPIHVTSALHREGVETLRATVGEGMTVALVGSSGAGKSTLVNALSGEARMLTGEVRASDGRGCHVTTHRQLVILPGGGLLLDTPGMRELRLVDDEGLDAVFADLAALAEGCRYRDCRHDHEPGCAVKAAISQGELDGERLAHYRKLEREAQANEIRQDVHKRRQAERVWGQMVNEVKQLHHKWKGG